MTLSMWLLVWSLLAIPGINAIYQRRVGGKPFPGPEWLRSVAIFVAGFAVAQAVLTIFYIGLEFFA